MELLLRAYDKKQGYVAYQCSLDLETLSSFIYHFGDCEISNHIGICDKNGNKIFSNDIIRLTRNFGFNSDIIKSDVCQVFYNEKECRYMLKCENYNIPLNFRHSKDYEIIGNNY